jgi:hypothetical protein
MINYIKGYLQDCTDWDGNLSIDESDLLALIEAYGMSPPGYPSQSLEGDGEFIYEWEPEDEA